MSGGRFHHNWLPRSYIKLLMGLAILCCCLYLFAVGPDVSSILATNTTLETEEFVQPKRGNGQEVLVPSNNHTISSPSKSGDEPSNGKSQEETAIDKNPNEAQEEVSLEKETPSLSSPVSVQWTFPTANTTLTNAKRAIVLLSMGKDAAKSTLVERILISIRKRGQFLGPVIVLTDCSLVRFQNLTAMDPNFYAWQPLDKDWNFNLPKDMPYKRFKTYSLEYLDLNSNLNSVRILYYLDIDIVVGRPLQNWFDHVETKFLANNQTPSSSRQFPKMVFFEGNYKHLPLQGGQFVVRRNSSESCLHGWRMHMDATPTEDKDQISLRTFSHEQMRLQKNGNTSQVQCVLEKMAQKPHLKFLDTRAMRRILNSTLEYATLMHVKNTQFASKIPDKLQQQFYKWLLDLTPDQAQLMGKVRIRASRNWSTTILQQRREGQQNNGTVVEGSN